MWKAFSALCLVGAVGGMTLDAALGCGGGGGGGGCGSGGGGRGRYGGARAVASSKVLSGGPRVARNGAPVAKANAPLLAADRSSAPVTTVATTKTKAGAVIAPLYTCLMHPQVQWTKPTDCPICGMKLKLKQTSADAVKCGTPAVDDHAGMNMDEMGDMPGMVQDDMGGMDDMMMCPGCMMNMGGMSGKSGKQVPAASRKAGGRMTAMAGMGCGC